MSAEQLVDGVIKYIQMNIAARTHLTEETLVGGNVLKVDDTFHFDDVNEIAIASDGDFPIEYHTILKKVDTTTIILLHPVTRQLGPSNGAIIQKAIGNVPLYENKVLFGDREVIPIEEGVAVTVEPVDQNNDWIYLQGGLNEEYNLSITIYARRDKHENAQRLVLKYSDSISRLLNSKVHMDIVNDVVMLETDIAAGSTTIEIPTIDGWGVDEIARYEVQDNNHAEIDFRIDGVTAPNLITLSRPLVYNYRVTDKLRFIRRVRYIYDSRVNRIEYGNVSKNSTMFKVAKLSWFGKETEEHGFPQPSKS